MKLYIFFKNPDSIKIWKDMQSCRMPPNCQSKPEIGMILRRNIKLYRNKYGYSPQPWCSWDRGQHDTVAPAWVCGPRGGRPSKRPWGRPGGPRSMWHGEPSTRWGRVPASPPAVPHRRSSPVKYKRYTSSQLWLSVKKFQSVCGKC